jgi:hypothetical protein
LVSAKKIKGGRRGEHVIKKRIITHGVGYTKTKKKSISCFDRRVLEFSVASMIFACYSL